MSKTPPDPLFTLHGGMKAIHSIYFKTANSQQCLIYCGTESGFIHIWDFQMLRQLKTLQIGSMPIVSILHYENFITQEKGGAIAFWKETELDWQRITSFSCDYKMFCKILSFDSILVHPCSDNQIRFSNISNVSELNFNEGVVSELDTKSGMIMCARYSSKHNRVILAFENGTVRSVNPTNGKFVEESKFNSECPLSFDYCDFANFGIIGYNNENIFKFTIETGGGILKSKSTTLTNPGTSSIAIRKDGLIFIVGTWDKAIRYFSSKSLKLLAVLTHHNGPVECLLFTQGKKENNELDSHEECLLAGSRDGRVSIWNLYPT